MAVRALAVLHAVEGTDAPRPDPMGAGRPDLAAARVLGADLFAPYQLARLALHAELEEAVALTRAFQLFPPAAETAAETAAEATGGAAQTTAQAPEPAACAVAWRDWAAAELLGRCAPAAPEPMPDRSPVLGEELPWPEWSGWMAQVSPLALPGIDSPVHETARRETRALARGTVRATLRRDYRTAARIARWLALATASGAACPLDLAPLLRHLRLFGGPSARTALDLRVGERLVHGAQR